jgi:hypothetical protein
VVSNVGGYSKSFNKGSQHHDNLSYSGHKNFNSPKPKKVKSIYDSVANFKLPTFGPGPKVNNHGNGKKDCKKW